VCLAGTLQAAGVKDNPFRAQLDRGPGEWAPVSHSRIPGPFGPKSRRQPDREGQQNLPLCSRELAYSYEVLHGVSTRQSGARKSMPAQGCQPALLRRRAADSVPTFISEQRLYGCLRILEPAEHVVQQSLVLCCSRCSLRSMKPREETPSVYIAERPAERLEPVRVPTHGVRDQPHDW